MTTLTVGQTVSVPWGLDTLEGTVLRAYDTGAGPRVLVRVRLPGTGEAGEEGAETTLTLPAESVEPIDVAPDRPQPGTWVAARAYERHVAEALMRVMARIADSGEISESSGDQGADLLLHSGDSVIAVEAKHLTTRSRLSAEEADRAIEIARRTLLPTLLVTNANPAPGALTAFLRRQDAPNKIALVRWRNQTDDTDLESELRLLLADPSNQEQRPT